MDGRVKKRVLILLHLAAYGGLPWSADAVHDANGNAARAAGMFGIGIYAMRHTERSWLHAIGAPIAAQQKLMRHADIRTTMNV